MINIYDGAFDKRWTSELASSLIKCPWYATNVANRHTWPYKETGSHRLLGHSFLYNKKYSNHDPKLNEILTNAFGHIQHLIQQQMVLTEIGANLQFKGMDGTLHVDRSKKEYTFILMLCNEEVENIGGGFIHDKKKISFKHGRLIQIKASDPHCGLSFNKPHIARMSIKWMGREIHT